MALGSTETVYAVDVAVRPFAVVARHQPGSSAADVAELQAILDSIELEAPVNPSPSPAAASPTVSTSVAGAYEAVFLRLEVVAGAPEVLVIGADPTGKEREIARLPGAWTAYDILTGGGYLAPMGAVSPSGLLAIPSSRGEPTLTTPPLPLLHWEIFDLHRPGAAPIVIAGIRQDLEQLQGSAYFTHDMRPSVFWGPGERLAIPWYDRCGAQACNVVFHWTFFDGRTGAESPERLPTEPDCRTRTASGAEISISDGGVVRRQPDGTRQVLATPGGVGFACLAPDDSMIVHGVDIVGDFSGLIDPEGRTSTLIQGNFAGFLEVAP
jgi:hypothetical protein